MKRGKKKALKPVFTIVRGTWTRRPVTTVKQSTKAVEARKKCRGKVVRSGDDMCAVAA